MNIIPGGEFMSRKDKNKGEKKVQKKAKHTIKEKRRLRKEKKKKQE